jgi:uncharacterized membrane protein
MLAVVFCMIFRLFFSLSPQDDELLSPLKNNKEGDRHQSKSKTIIRGEQGTVIHCLLYLRQTVESGAERLLLTFLIFAKAGIFSTNVHLKN